MSRSNATVQTPFQLRYWKQRNTDLLPTPLVDVARGTTLCRQRVFHGLRLHRVRRYSRGYSHPRERLSATCLLGTMLVLACAHLAAQSPMTFNYVYDDIGQLVKVIDSTGIVIEYVYDEVGNMLEIKRSNIPAPTGLSIFDFAPKQGPPFAMLTIQGQGFSPVASENAVRLSGLPLAVVSASPNSLVATVAPGAATGPVTVTVGSTTAQGPQPFVVLAGPVVTSVNRRIALPNVAIANFRVTGVNLSGAMFSFVPVFSPAAVTVDSVVADAAGTGATLRLTVGSEAAGTFTVVATNGAGSSSPFASFANSFSIVREKDEAKDSDGDGLTDFQEGYFGTDPFNSDTDCDGFSDAVEIAAGSDPLDPNSTPLNDRTAGEVVSQTFSTLNTVAPPSQPREVNSHTFSLLNTVVAPMSFREANSVTFSVLNTINAPMTLSEAVSVSFSLCNGMSTPACSAVPLSISSDSDVLTDAGDVDGGRERPHGDPPDADADGVSNEQELAAGTNPFSADSDGDGFPDGLEIELGADPLDPLSIPQPRGPGVAVSSVFGVENIAVYFAKSDEDSEEIGGDHASATVGNSSLEMGAQ